MLPDALRLGAVHLTVADLDRAVTWYQDVLGLRVQRLDGGLARLGVGDEDLVVLVEEPGAQPPGRHAGLYHYCLLYPSRAELARAAQRLAERRTPIDGASDHGTHEAIYLPDADGNGIELAWDRDRSQWPDVRSPAGYAGGPRPLDTQDLLGSIPPDEGTWHAGAGLRVGHLHLHVGDIEEALAFYRDRLGFEEMVDLGSAAFVSAGGYHHHLGFNVWRGPGVGPQPAGHVGLRHWTVVLPAQADVDALAQRLPEADARGGSLLLRDPWGIQLHVTASQ